VSDRRFGSAAVLSLLAILAAGEAAAFGFEEVERRARELAAAAYTRPASNLPPELKGIGYDQYRDIRFKRNRFLWSDAKLPFEVAFFHQGWFYELPVKVHEVAGDQVRDIAFDARAFDYGQNKLDAAKMQGLGFAGFRVHYPLHSRRYKDEVVVFLGASYFRALGHTQRYGLSARGLALDTAAASGEEFPRFSEFWIERPQAKAAELTIYALLESRRVTGAYRFILKPGRETVMEVKARLYLREKVGKLGVAPLTSMFLFGENQRAVREDYRPEVHDSDGLSIRAANGEWIWRPLVNPRRLLVTSFATASPAGFGLMQRDRRFGRYEDLEARYEMRPSAWVEPKGAWGAGRIELVQIPAPDETNDNIVAYWVPEQLPAPGQPFDIEYDLRWQKLAEARPPLAAVVQTRRGLGYARKPDNTLGFVVDFEGDTLRKLLPDAKVVSVVSADANAQILEKDAYRNSVTGGWRMVLRLRRLDDTKPVELRGHLRSAGETLSETWSYVLPPS
jgi:periplasmic glucans biosynthesis protein